MFVRISFESLVALAFIGLILVLPLNAQNDKIYNWSWKKDGIVLGASGTVWGLAQYMKEKADKATIEDLALLDPSDLWGFDRGAIGNNSSSARSLSNVLLFSATALPFLSQLDKNANGNRTAILGMAIEGFLITDGVTNLFKAGTKRFRPFTYDSNIPIEEKLSSTARQSFISGHTSIIAFSTFYTAKIFADLHPDSTLRPFVLSAAIAVPAVTGYLRYRGGRHFPTDIIAGYALGAAVGYLVPEFHKSKRLKIGVGSNMGLRTNLAF